MQDLSARGVGLSCTGNVGPMAQAAGKALERLTARTRRPQCRAGPASDRKWLCLDKPAPAPSPRADVLLLIREARLPSARGRTEGPTEVAADLGGGPLDRVGVRPAVRLLAQIARMV